MIYVHVPFCRSFCTYCDFYSELACKGKDEEAFARWADEVCAEIDARRGEIAATLDLDTLYIGGGTPSVLPLSVLRRITDALDAGPYREFTIEVNPEDIIERGPEYVRGLLDLGVNRISMGVQSLDDRILRWMNRRHSANGARQAFSILKAAAQGSIPSPTASLRCAPLCASDSGAPENPLIFGVACRGWRRSCEGISPCADISIDLISGVPGMTMEILEETVEEVTGWHPEHISAYQLSIEEGSALARMIEKGEVQELGEDECRAQYDYLCRRLAEAGYRHYEISNWALPGHEAVHNSAYWTRHPYVGLGPGAHSLIRNRRSWNSQTPSGWMSESETLTPEQIHTEEVMLLARTDRGPIPEKDWFVADDIITDLL